MNDSIVCQAVFFFYFLYGMAVDEARGKWWFQPSNKGDDRQLDTSTRLILAYTGDREELIDKVIDTAEPKELLRSVTMGTHEW